MREVAAVAISAPKLPKVPPLFQAPLESDRDTKATKDTKEDRNTWSGNPYDQ